MQVKVVIGTVAFMLTMMVMGFVALREPHRLETFSAAAHGRSVETGAELFQNNCATCHGPDGTATTGCTDPDTGEPGACRGLPLNDYFLLCGDRPVRLDDMNWVGTKRQFIEQTVSAGRVGTVMPTWSFRFGGPMRDDQIQNVVDFVLNWEDTEGAEALCNNPPPEFLWPELVEDFLVFSDDEVTIETGDPIRGAEVYVEQGCVACHGDPAEEGSNKVGPWLGEFAEVGAERVEGQSALQYVYTSILEPNAFVAPDCPTGPCQTPSAMLAKFVRSLAKNPQDMADLLAYLVGTEE